MNRRLHKNCCFIKKLIHNAIDADVIEKPQTNGTPSYYVPDSDDLERSRHYEDKRSDFNAIQHILDDDADPDEDVSPTIKKEFNIQQ